MSSITSANSTFTLVIPGLFPVPQQLQGYATDDAFTADAIDNAETMMGVDGRLSAGWTPNPVNIAISLQADSPSMATFEAWYAAEQAAQEKYLALGNITLPGPGRTYALVNAYLTNYTPFAAAKKVLQPRTFRITCESVLGAPI